MKYNFISIFVCILLFLACEIIVPIIFIVLPDEKDYVSIFPIFCKE